MSINWIKVFILFKFNWPQLVNNCNNLTPHNDYGSLNVYNFKMILLKYKDKTRYYFVKSYLKMTAKVNIHYIRGIRPIWILKGYEIDVSMKFKNLIEYL